MLFVKVQLPENVILHINKTSNFKLLDVSLLHVTATRNLKFDRGVYIQYNNFNSSLLNY